jgi:hypothetical protein
MNTPRPRPLSRLLFVLAAVAVTVFGLVVPASAAAPYCGITWGSQPRHDAGLSTEGVAVTNLRAGRHACYDRLVIDLTRSGGFGGYDVYYGAVPATSGLPVPLDGGADLVINVHAAALETYQPRNRDEAVAVDGFSTFRQVDYVESFEGYTLVGLGVRARLPFRVFVLPASPGRMIVDVAHHW